MFAKLDEEIREKFDNNETNTQQKILQNDFRPFFYLLIVIDGK